MLDIIINPFITILLAYYAVLGNVFLTIVAFTITIRLAILPLTLRQQRSLKAMQAVQPELKRLQDKYKNDREVLMQKQMELYREHKINPLAGCWPLLIQLPILIGLWRAIIATLAADPNQLLNLADRVLIPGLDASVPLDNQFLWLNLAVPDPFLVLPLLVVVTTWLQQKLLMPAAPRKKSGKSDDPADQAAAMTRQMTTFMPIMFGVFALTYSSGLSIYFIVSNLIGIAIYARMGRANFGRLIGREPLHEDDEKELKRYGRRRKVGISDTRDSKVAASFVLPAGETRSQRVKNAKAKARRVQLKLDEG